MYPAECVSYKHLIYIKLMKAIFSYIKFLVISFIKSLHTIQILFYNWSHSLYFLMWSINFIFYIFNRLFSSQKCGKLHIMLQISLGKTYKRYCKSHEWYNYRYCFLYKHRHLINKNFWSLEYQGKIFNLYVESVWQVFMEIIPTNFLLFDSLYIMEI